MLDYKVEHYVRQVDLTYVQNQNILRSFMFTKQKYFPDGSKDKFKVRLVADGSQQRRHLYEFVSSATVSLQVVCLLFNIIVCCLLHTVDIRGAFLTLNSQPPIAYLSKNKLICRTLLDSSRYIGSTPRIRARRIIIIIRSISLRT